MKYISRIICAALALTLCVIMLPTSHASWLGDLYNNSQNQFWQTFDHLTNGNGPDSVHSAAPAATPNPPAETIAPSATPTETPTALPSEAPTETPAPAETPPVQVTSEPAPVATTPVVDSSTTIINQTTNNTNNYYGATPTESIDPEYIYINGERYRRVDEGGELTINDKMYSRDDEVTKPKKESLWDLMVQDWNLRTKMFVYCIPFYLIILAVVSYRMYKKSHHKRR